MKKILLFIAATLVLLLTSSAAFADMGPKPSLDIYIKNAPADYYAVFLAKSPDPIGYVFADNYDELDEIEKKFADYEDSDGFIAYCWGGSFRELNVGAVRDHYMPSKEFKLLMYFPDSDRFAVSEIYETYAFSSRFTADLEGKTVNELCENKITLKSSQIIPNNSDETAEDTLLFQNIGFLTRMLLTIAIEIGVGALFGYRKGKQILFISLINAATQLGINILLNVIAANTAVFVAMILYIPVELVIFGAEAGAYAANPIMREVKSQKPVLNAVLYSLAANFASFVIGIVLMLVFL